MMPLPSHTEAETSTKQIPEADGSKAQAPSLMP